MICFLQGIISDIGTDWLSLNVNGVGYKAYCSQRTLGTVKKDEPFHLITHLHVREQEMTLFGFSSSQEKEAFEKLTSVSGVGPKVGLAILSTLTTQEIAEAVTLQNGKMIARANGVGPKLGERVVRELKGKMGGFTSSLPTATDATIIPETSVVHDVLSALTNLGYKPEKIQKTLAETHAAMPEAGFDTLFKNTLKSLQ